MHNPRLAHSWVQAQAFGFAAPKGDLGLEVSNQRKNHKEVITIPARLVAVTLGSSRRHKMQSIKSQESRVPISWGGAVPANEDPPVLGYYSYLKNLRIWHSGFHRVRNTPDTF